MREITRYKWLGFFAYYLLGSTMTGIAAAMPVIRETLSLTYEGSGAIFAVGSIGFLLGSLLGGTLLEWIGLKKTLLVGILLFPVGLVLFGLGRSMLLLSIGNVFVGLGTGLLEVGLPPLASQLSKTPGGLINQLHSYFALGALISPVLVALSVSSTGSWQLFFLLSLVLVAFPALLVPGFQSVRQPHVEKGSPSHVAPSRGSFLKHPFFWIICLMGGFYVSSEMGTSNWAPMYATDFLGTSPEMGGLLPSLFWIGLFSGRQITAWLIDRVGLLRWLFGVSLVGLPLVFFALRPLPNPVFLGIFIVISGLVHASIFPTLQSLLVLRVRSGVGLALGLYTSFGSLGGSASGFLVGVISERAGISTGFFSVFFFFLATAVLAVWLFLLERKNHLPQPRT
ncbi:MAG TPA: MFS transporter [Thermotogota bacterium]|nr:MFS transporter [Thermotogota bacterium]HRW92066.1 MFS transporter [Thermotogota bacterium]